MKVDAQNRLASYAIILDIPFIHDAMETQLSEVCAFIRDILENILSKSVATVDVPHTAQMSEVQSD